MPGDSIFYVSQMGHVVNVLPPVDITGGATTGVVFSMETYSHASVILQFGVTGASCNVTVEECDAFSPSVHPDITFSTFKEETAAGDTLGALVSAATLATSTNNSIMYVIELDAAQLSEGYPYVRLNWSNPGQATLASAVAILSGARYACDQSATVIA